MHLSGKVAVVTGVTSEIGRATALRLASEGAAVAVTGHTPSKLDAVIADLRKVGAKFHAGALDLSQPQVVDEFFAEVARILGPVDILVNTAAWRVRQPFLETTYADWRRTFEVCVEAKGAVHALAKAMAVDLAPHGITVNVVAPGVVETQYVRANLTPAQIQKRLERIPAGRLASPDDCAAAVAHLAAPDMGYLTGQIVYVDGGFLSAGVLAR
ncbi:MAG: SDR family oxidoreductase [candidate division NC10 bacterium]|nr:SDR family oxidoreductase [candidate division NC10 bacterium]